MNVEALRPPVSPAPHQGAAGRFVARARLLPVMLAAAWVIAVAGHCQAGVILTCESFLSAQTVGEASSVLPADNYQRSDGERVSAENYNMLPSGTGTSNGGAPLGISTIAALDQPCGLFLPPGLGCILEERRLSLPASPVFDRLRPPRLP